MQKVGLIPAAGKGQRLGLPFSKELYPIPFKMMYYPVILNNILALKSINITEIVIIISPDKHDIMKYLGNGSRWDVIINYVIQEKAVSLPDALSKGYNIIFGKEVYFLMADTLIEPNDFLIDFYEKINRDYEISLGCFYTDNPGKFATLEMVNGVVNFCEEKNPESSSNIMWGFWRWSPSFTEKLIEATNFHTLVNGEQTMSEIIREKIKLGMVQGILLDNYKYWDLGTFDEIDSFITDNE